MCRPDSPEHAMRQAAMWRRLADQCRRRGDRDLERDARMLARKHLQLARLRMAQATASENLRPGVVGTPT